MESTIVVVFGALALLVVLAGFLLGGDRGRARFGRPVRRSDELAQLRHELQHARAETRRARSESDRLRRLAALPYTIGVEALLTEVLETTVRLSGTSGAMLFLQGDGPAEPLVATFGLSPAESSRWPLGLPPKGTEARAVVLDYRYGKDEDSPDDRHLRGGIAVPIRGDDGDSIGTLALFWRDERTADETDTILLEDLAGFLPSAIEHAGRFQELRELEGTHSPMGFPGERSFAERLRSEYGRARRYNRRLAMILIHLGELPEPSLALLSERIHTTARASDAAFDLGDGRLALLLPEAGREDADRLRQRLAFRLGSLAGESSLLVEASAGIAVLEEEDDPVSLLRRAEGDLARVRMDAHALSEGPGRLGQPRIRIESTSLDP